MQIYYKPEDGWAADFIPFFWQGEYHLFYLKDYRDPAGHGEGTPWCHLVTRDLTHFKDFGECLRRGTPQEQDLYVFTGSVVYGEGRFHIFYTGHNPHLRQAGKPEQAIMHAVSDDLYTWRKVPEDTFFSPGERFEPHDWRDPFVFYNEEAGEYWMLTAARLKSGPSRRRGCTALCASRDLVKWEVRDSFYTPGLYFTHECPDLFRIGEWWYLMFSEFSEACVTRYRMARSLAGPWLTPAVDTFDGRALYAAKTASDGQRRLLFGWNPTRQGDTDTGGWQWGGNLAVHELTQRADGTLAVSIPAEVRGAYANARPARFERAWNTDLPEGSAARLDAAGTFAALSAGLLPDSARIEARACWKQDGQGFGIYLRGSADFESGYYIRVEPRSRRLVFDSWPRAGDLPHMVEIERPIYFTEGQEVRLTVTIQGTLCEVYLNGETAMSARMYNHPAGEWGLFAQDCAVEFDGVTLALPDVG
jgi:beta-fructofuranosidase